jgi:dTDP-4-amino-4,6-dideoxygalactose transaminase
MTTQPVVTTSTTSALAVDGGEPIIRRGYVARSRWPHVEDDDIERVVSYLRSGFFTEMSGRDPLHEFESEIASVVGARYAMATNSGTAALHCALAGVGVEAGDEVVLPALTFVACAAAVLHQNAIPIFADVDPFTYNVTPETVEAAITERTRAVMVVHLHGLPADMTPLRALTERRGVALVEDFSQAFGATYRGRNVGGLGTVGAASLMAGKNLPSAGEAGVLVTDDREVRNRAAALKCFGERIDADGQYSLIHETAGWNYRASLLTLAMASQQLFRLDEYCELRRAMARRLDSVIAQVPGLAPPHVPDDREHAYHMYRFRIEPEQAGVPLTADQMREGLRSAFAAEGLPLVEFQNQPLPGHALVQGRAGRGRPCSCQGPGDVRYRIEDHPGALDAIRHSLVVGMPAQAPLCNADLVEHYVHGFEKIRANMPAFVRYAARLPLEAPPWREPARLF